MYASYLCDRQFKTQNEVLNIYRVLRRRSWGDILQALDAIAYSKKSTGKDYHDGWIRIEQSKLADRTNYNRSYLSTQILELQAIGLLDLKRIKLECYHYKFTSLAKEVFSLLARLPLDRFKHIKSAIRNALLRIASEFTKFTEAPVGQITGLWSQIRENLTSLVENPTRVIGFSTYIQDPLQDPIQEIKKLTHEEPTVNCQLEDEDLLVEDKPTNLELKGIQAILTSTPPTDTSSLEVIPNLLEECPSAARITKSKTQNTSLFGKPRTKALQEAKAKVTSHIERGIVNRRWSDRAEFIKFRDYVTEWARQRREGAVKGTPGVTYDERFVETVLARTATCTDNDSNILTCWKNWQLEKQAYSPIFVAEPKHEVQDLAPVKAALERIRASIAESKREKAKREAAIRE